MSFSYDRYERRQRRLPSFDSSSRRTALGYWVPLALTVTAATVGLAAWAWNERRNNDDVEELDYSDNAEYARKLEKERRDLRPGLGGAPPSFQSDLRPGEVGYDEAQQQQQYTGEVRRDFDTEGVAIEDREEQEGFVAQMRGAIRRTPSPQKLYEGARERVAAGVAAVGKGLTSITEEKGDDYVDHERWSEEADSQEQAVEEQRGTGAIAAGLATSGAAAAASAASALSGPRTGRAVPIPASKNRGRKRMIAIVVSAESDKIYAQAGDESTYQVEHASILSHLVGHATSDAVDLVILIFAPTIQSHPLSSNNPIRRSRRTSSGDSSFSAIEAPEDPDAAEDQIISQYSSSAYSPSTLYTALTTQAASLVTHPTHILPFTTPTGHIHLLRHLAPNLVYMQESMCGGDGDVVKQIEGWVGQVIVLIGAEGAGLVDTETEDEAAKEEEGRTSSFKGKSGKWWMDESRVGFGKGIEIVEGMRVGEDWEKRIGGS